VKVKKVKLFPCVTKYRNMKTYCEGKNVKLSLCVTKYHAMKTYWG